MKPKIRPNEEFILMFRRHWIILLFKVIKTSALAIFPLIIFIVGQKFTSDVPQELWNFFWFFSSLWWLSLWTYFFIFLVDYYLDVWIVSNQRIIDIEQKGLFKREISEFSLARIQDITVDVSGFLPTLLQFGNVHIQTAGEEEKFVFKQIPNPHRAKNLILKLCEKYISAHKIKQQTKIESL